MKSSCLVDSCERQTVGQGYCNKHYLRIRRNGSVEAKKYSGRRKNLAYGCWMAMKARCNNPNVKKYPNYGGRGIKVCNKWSGSFDAFLEDMGERPSLIHSIDRINNDGNYEPGNCRWATPKEQQNNRRNNKQA